MVNSDTTECRKCQYYREYDTGTDVAEENKTGWCHKYAPKPVTVKGDRNNSEEHSVEWPEVFATDFCGEFNPK